MAHDRKKQPQKRKPVMLDEQTHADVAAYAESQKRSITVVVKELVYSNPRMQRFLNKSTQGAQQSENHNSTTL